MLILFHLKYIKHWILNPQAKITQTNKQANRKKTQENSSMVRIQMVILKLKVDTNCRYFDPLFQQRSLRENILKF